MSGNRDLAVIGMAGKYPRAGSPGRLWQAILDEEDLSEDHGPASSDDDKRVTRHFKLDGIERFDHEFFGLTPFEAMIMDPQHRLLLTCAHLAAEDAGYEVFPQGDRVGVYASCSISTYLLHHVIHSRHYDPRDLNYQILLGNDKDALASRVAYKLNLTGPALTVQTACSSSLVATHIACQGLLCGDCDIAIVAAASITVPQDAGYYRKEGGILSKDGYCRPFDAQATGTIKGNGCSVLVLRRLPDAESAGDRIRARICATAINNDGHEKLGFTAPSASGQREVIDEALSFAGLSPEEVDYIEAHGTGTELGDPIELSALSQVYGSSGRQVPIGSLKATIGHLDAAAGLSGLIKACYVLEQGIVPALQHLRQPTDVPAARSFEFPKVQSRRTIRHAAVSSFGIGGTNAHAVLGRYQAPDPVPRRHPARYLLRLSANTDADLSRYVATILQTLREGAELLDVAAAQLERRRRRDHVRTVVLSSADSLERAVSQAATVAAGAAMPLPRLGRDDFLELARDWPAFSDALPALASAHTAAQVLAEMLLKMGCLSPSLPAAHYGLGEDDFIRACAGDARALAPHLLDAGASSAGQAGDALARVLGFIARLDMQLPLDLGQVYAGTRWRSIALPAYPLNERPHWVEAEPQRAAQKDAEAAPAAAPMASAAGPRHDEDVLAEIVAIWRELTGEDSLDADTTMVDTGADSMTAIEIVDRVNRGFRCEIALDMSVAALTPTQMTELVLGREMKSSAPWLSHVRFKRSEYRTIFLIHPAGGSTYCYSSMARHLQGAFNVCAIDLPEGYRGYGSLEALAARYAAQLRAQAVEGPVLLGGYSFGGNLAHEVACQLERDGVDVGAVVLFDSHTPEAYNRYESGTLDYIGAFPTLITSYFKPELLGELRRSERQVDSLEAAIRQVRDLNVLNSRLADEDIARFYERWTFSHELLKRHRPAQVCRAPAVVLVAREDEPAVLLEKLRIERLPKDGWRHHFAGAWQQRGVEGDHFTMFGDAHKVKQLASVFDEVMKVVLAG